MTLIELLIVYHPWARVKVFERKLGEDVGNKLPEDSVLSEAG